MQQLFASALAVPESGIRAITDVVIGIPGYY